MRKMSRLAPLIVFAFITTVLALAAGCTVQIGDTRGDTRQFEPGIGYPARVTHITDGDTLRVLFPDGHQETVRLLGVDAPELSPGDNDPGTFQGVSDPLLLAVWGEEASLALRRELTGMEVTVSTDRAAGERDRYGRLLAYLSTGNNTDIGETLLSGGLTRVYTAESFARKERYLAVQHAAIQKRIGIWSGMTPAQPGGVFLATVHYDAAGDDRLNLADEYITLRNGGSTPVNLTGWQIQDGGMMIFSFPEITLNPGAEFTVRTGSGPPREQDLAIGSPVPLLGNDGGTVTLHDRDGAEQSRFTW
jgi:micrococcal nuclease